MITSHTKFTYYVPIMIKYIISKNKPVVQKKYIWNPSPFLQWVYKIKRQPQNQRPQVKLDLGNTNHDYGSIEWKNSKDDKANKLFAIRLSKLKSNGLPARRWVNTDSRSINLKPGEFLDSFNLLVFDYINKRVAVQKNSAGLGTSQIESILTDIFNRWVHNVLKKHNVTYKIEFLELENKKQVQNIRNGKIFRRINIKCADITKTNNIPKKYLKGAMGALFKLHAQYQGLSFNISISMSRSKRTDTLNKTNVQKLYDDVYRIKRYCSKNKLPNPIDLSIKGKNKLHDKLRDVDLLLPKLESTVTIYQKTRSTTPFKDVYGGFLKHYLGKIRVIVCKATPLK